MGRPDWEDEMDGVNLQFLDLINELNEETATRTLDFGKTEESTEIPGMTKSSCDNKQEITLIDYENHTSGENDCRLGCNSSSLLEALNMSTLASDIYGPHNDSDYLYEFPWYMIICLSLLYGAMSLSALFGNSLVLWIIAVSRRMRTVTNMFIANLALADFIIGLFAIPFQFQAALLQRWNLPDFMCAFCPFVQVLTVNVSVFTLSAIAVDRYRAILYPLSARVSKRKAAWEILTIWTSAFILALPMMLDYKVILITHKGAEKPFCGNVGLPATFRMFYQQSIVIIQYFFPLVILSGAYIQMGIKLKSATAPGNQDVSRDAVRLRNKKKAIKMLALVVLMFAICWLPLQLYNFFQSIFPQINQYQYINILWFGFYSLGMSSSCFNPFLYAIYNEKFQRKLRARLRCFSKRIDGGSLNDSDTDGSKNILKQDTSAPSGVRKITRQTGLVNFQRCTMYRKGNRLSPLKKPCNLKYENDFQNGTNHSRILYTFAFVGKPKHDDHSRHCHRQHCKHMLSKNLREIVSKYNGSLSIFETEMLQQETNLTGTNNAALTTTINITLAKNGSIICNTADTRFVNNILCMV